MPKFDDLAIRGHTVLISAIDKFGGFPQVAEVLGYPYDSRNSWNSIEDLRPHLDPLVAELGRMPGKLELEARKRNDLSGAVNKFGGFAQVSEALGYTYTFAPRLARRARYKELEAAILELDRAQQLSAGQVMIILRHAGLLSRRDFAEVAGKLQTAGATHGAELEAAMDELAEVLVEPADSSGEAMAGSGVLAADVPAPEADALHQFGPVAWSSELNSQGSRRIAVEPETQDEVAPPADLGRDRNLEIKELRGWSAVGNLLDPAPALERLSVARLKTTFYRFANERYRTLAVPPRQPTPQDVDALSADLHEVAFGTYGEYLTNDLVRRACEAYVGDLARSLLIPRAPHPKYRPYLYQLDGARFIAERVASSDAPFGLLLDQPGMGKSLTTLWGLAAASVERFVIVAPLTVKHEVWTSDTLRVAFPSLSDERVARSLAEALALPPDGPAVVLLHYAELHRHEEIRALAAPRADGSCPFDVLVLDEAHEVKERVSGTAQRGPLKQGAWLLRTGAPACVGITATPLVNELYEPISLLQLAKGEDDPEMGRRLRSSRVRDRVDVMEYLLGDSLRRTKGDVLFEIPTRTITTHSVTPNARQLASIQAFLARSRRAVANDLPAYRKLVLDVKLDDIADRVSRRHVTTTHTGQPDPKVLVLCYNVDDVSERVYERLAVEFGTGRIRHVNGATPVNERKEALSAFRAPADAESGVLALVGSVGTVGVGVTLFDANQPVTPHRIIFADLPYTWAEFEQAVDRLHRVGQRFAVQIEVPIVTFPPTFTRADGEPLSSFDGWVWDLIASKERLADQVLDAAFDVSGYTQGKVQRAIRDMLRALHDAGGAVLAPPPPEDSPAAEHRRALGRYRALPRQRAADIFLRNPDVSVTFLRENDASRSAILAQQLVRERLGRWLDRRSLVVDLGCGSNPLRDLSCQVLGIDRHGVNGGRVGDMAATELPSGEADFVAMSLSMWGTPADRLAYLREAKRLLRPLGKLIVVEPAGPFGGPEKWQAGAERLRQVVGQLGMRLAEPSEHSVEAGTSLVTFIIDNSSTPPRSDVIDDACDWAA